MKAALYVRVSTDEQAQEGFSIDAQLKVLRAWAVVKSAEVVGEYVDDGYSAKNLNRPAMQRLLASCKARQVDTVIVWRLDRLSRSLRDTLALVEDVFRANGVEFVSATESIDTSSASGRLVLNILASAAQNEREVNEERVRMVTRDLAEQCVHLGGVPPYGYRVEGRRLAIDEREAPAVRMIFSMRAQGYGYGEIIDRLHEAGYRTRSGRPFAKNGLHDLLKNPKYCGVYVYNRAAAADRAGKRNNHASKNPDDVVVVPGGVPAIVDSGTWQLVQERMREDAHRGGAYSARHVYMCSGLVKCAYCDRAMPVENVGRSRDGSYQYAYRCPSRCGKAIRVERLDELVYAFLDALARDLSRIPEAVEIANRVLAQANVEAVQEAQELNSRLANLEAQTRAIVEFIASAGAAAPASLAGELNRLDAERERVRAQLSHLVQYTQVDPDTLRAGVAEPISLRDCPDGQKKQTALRRIISRISVADQTVYIDLNVAADSPTAGGGDPQPPMGLSVIYGVERACNSIISVTAVPPVTPQTPTTSTFHRL